LRDITAAIRPLLTLGVSVIAAACSQDVAVAPVGTPGPRVDVSTATSATASGTITTRLNSNLCVVISGGSGKSGAAAILSNCRGGGSQQWTATSAGELRADGTSLCLDASSGEGNDGDAIILWSCHGEANQQWGLTSAGELRGINDKCIDLRGSAHSGTALMLNSCSGRASQTWNAPTTGTVASAPQDSTPTTEPTPDTTPTNPGGVLIKPGESIQAAVNANPAGTTFVLASGTHTGQSVTPKAGDAFIGEAGAILDGAGSVICAFCPGSTKPANVRIAHLEIRNYGPASPTYNNVYGDGAIKGGGDEISDGTRGWVVDSNYIHDNRNMGIRIGVKMLVRGNRIVHNAGPHGLGGIGDSAVIVGNEIATNNYLDRFDPGFSAGGFKFVLSTGVVIKSNWIHHNHGMGAWGDIANRNMTFDGNTVEDNTTVGIMYEISYGCKVTNNIARRNGLGDPNNWLYPAGILIAHSPDCEVANNTLDGNVHGIIGIQQNRTDDMVYGPHTLKNLWVHDNTVTHSGSGFAAGVGADYGDPFGAAANNKFDRNQYTTAATAPFAWAGGGQSWSAWRGYGEDAAGTLTSR
jgi:parallel beta-helix repeat protein